MNDDDLEAGLDTRLRHAFDPPPAAAFAEQAARVVDRPAARPLWPWVMAAAALLLVGFLLFDRPARRGPEGHDGRELGAMWAAAFADAVERGFSGGGGGCCEAGFDLSSACQERFAERLEVASAGGVAVVGGYCGLSTGGCMTVLAKHGAEPLCVCIVRREHDPHVELPAGSALHLARREVDDLVLYALSKSPPAAALEQFVVPVQ